MGQVVFIMWRESVEALLVVGILHAWLACTPQAATGRGWLWAGVVLGLLCAALLAAGIYSAQSLLIDWQEQFQTLMVLGAAALIAHMVLWMRAHGRTLQQDMERELSQHMAQHHGWGIALLTTLAIAREGSEAVVFLYGTVAAASRADWPMLALSATGGLALALATFWLLQLGQRWLTWSQFFRLTEGMLLLLAGALIITGVEKMQNLEWLPPLVDGLWDSAWLLSDMEPVGGVVAAFTGYRTQPSLMMLLAWAAYWSFMLWRLHRTRARRPAAPLPAPVTQGVS